MAKGTQYSQQSKEDAIRYKEDHPELTIRKADDDLVISESALKSWIKTSKENGGTVPTRGSNVFRRIQRIIAITLRKRSRRSMMTLIRITVLPK